MKLINKLARSEADKLFPPELGPGNKYFNAAENHRSFVAGFETGFMKARQMAADLCDRYDLEMGAAIELDIRRLGEEGVL